MDIPQTTYGIQALIERLRGEGIDAGREEAARLLEQARQDIERLRAVARQDADGLLDRARAQACIEQEASLAAIRLACRDSMLRLREDFLHQFGDRLRRRVRDELVDIDLLRRVLLALLTSGEAGKSNGNWHSDLDELVRDVGTHMLADGIELVTDTGRAGMRLRLTGQDLELHVTEDAVTDLLMEHLLPRVRRLLDGGPVAPEAPDTPELPGESPIAPRQPGQDGSRPAVQT